MKTLSLTLLALFLAFAAIAESRDESAFIQFQPTDTLYVQIIDSVSVRMGNVGRNDRFRRIRSTLEDVLEDAKFPMAYKISRFSSARPPADQPLLMLTILKWGDYGMSQIEVQFSASLRRSYDKNKLGMFYERGGPSFMADERVYTEVLREALEYMVFDLNERFAQGAVEEAPAPPDADEEGDEAEGENAPTAPEEEAVL